jgi:prevent-host-death family protein
MTIMIPLEEAKTKLHELCARARQGEDVVLTENGEPVGRLGPIEPMTPVEMKGKRPLGLHAGQVIVHDNFDDPLPDDLREAFGC